MNIVSIILPVYNSEKYIERTIRSVLNQTFFNFELIIINDGSTDNTRNICERLLLEDDRIKLYNKKNEGVSKARNYGIKKSNGKYLMFIDSDDIYESNIIERMYKVALENNTDIVRVSYKILNGNYVYEEINEGKYDKKEIREVIIEKILSEKIKCYLWLLLLKRNLFEEFQEDLFIFEDFDFYLKLFLKSNSVYILKEPLYLYNKNNYNSLTKKDAESNIYNIILARKYITETLIKNNIQSKIYILDTRIITIIINYIYYVQSIKGYKYAIDFYKKLQKSKKFKEIECNYNSMYTSKKEKIFNYTILNNHFLLYRILCYIKNFINKVRG